MNEAYFTSTPATIPAASRPTPSGCWTRRADAERMETALREIWELAFGGRPNFQQPVKPEVRFLAIERIARAALAPETSPVAEDFDLPGQAWDTGPRCPDCGYIVTGDRYRSIGVRVPGRIDRYFVEEGQSVKQGDPLVQIDDRDYRAAAARA